MIYTITKATLRTDQDGNTKVDNYGNHSYSLETTDEQGAIHKFYKSVKPPKVLKVGDTLSGKLEQKEGDGYTYYKFTADPVAYKAGGGGQESPEKQASIERQHSLTAAITYCTTKANILAQMGKLEEALEEMQGKHVIQVATYLAGYSSGKFNITMTPEEIAKVFGYKE